MSKLEKFKVQENQYSRPYHHLINLSSKKTYYYLYWGLEYWGYVKFILNQISKIKNKFSIAEIGCGDGKISIEIAKKYTKSNIEGYDLANQAIAFANSYSYDLKNCNFYNIDFNESKKNMI